MKFGSHMHVSKFTQVCSNQGCMTYFHWIMLMSFWVVTLLVYLQCITMCHYVISHWWLLLLNLCTDLLQILCGCSWGGPLLSLLKSGCYPYFSWNYGIILCKFWPILKKSSSIKPLTRIHSYLVWRVPRGSCFLFVQIRSLWPIFTILINDLR